MKAIAVIAMVAAVAFAGCANKGDSTDDIITDTDQLDSGKGAISGLVVDDRYRPIGGATVLLQELGQERITNADGEFQFVNLDPGAYRLRVTAAGHEAAPGTATVVEKQFAEATVIARRTTSEGGEIITQQYSVFIPCAVDFIADGYNLPCTLDSGGYESYFTIDYSIFENITYVVIEMKANQQNRYEVQHRGEGRYATANAEGDYARIQMKAGEMADRQDNPGYDYVAFNETDDSVQTIVFVDHAGREELQEAGSPTCCGVGFSMGVKAEFVISIFLGEPEVDVDSYRVYKE